MWLRFWKIYRWINSKFDGKYSSFYLFVIQFCDSDDSIIEEKKEKGSVEKREKQIERMNGYKTPKYGDKLKKIVFEYITNMINSIKRFIPK